MTKQQHITHFNIYQELTAKWNKEIENNQYKELEAESEAEKEILHESANKKDIKTSLLALVELERSIEKTLKFHMEVDILEANINELELKIS